MRSLGPILGSTAFILFGLFAMVHGGDWWIHYARTTHWERTEVQVLSNELRSERSRQDLAVQYRYRWNGQDYTSTQVALPARLRVKSEAWRYHQSLKSQQQAAQTIMAWIDPEQPSQAVLFRQPDAAHFGLPTFGLVFAILGFVFWSISLPPALLRWRLKHRTGPPWEREGRWPGGVIRTRPWTPVLGLSAISLVLGGFLAVFLIAMQVERVPGVLPILIGFSLITGGSVLTALYLGGRALRYGSARLVLHQVPLKPGGQMDAIVMLNRPLTIRGDIRCEIRCTRSYWERGHNNKKRWRRDVLVADQWTIATQQATATDHGWAIPLHRELPWAAGRNLIVEKPVRWRLVIRIPTRGIDVKARFELPVYASG